MGFARRFRPTYAGANVGHPPRGPGLRLDGQSLAPCLVMEIFARNSSGIPHLAKNVRDMGHPNSWQGEFLKSSSHARSKGRRILSHLRPDSSRAGYKSVFCSTFRGCEISELGVARKSFVFALVCLLVPFAAMAQTEAVAPGACAKCHVEALTQPSTFMAHALETVENSKVLTDHPVLATTVGQYTYRIERKGNESEYSVSDGTSTVTLPIRWTMGASSALGQTYILEKDGALYESRVSWFRELSGLAPTMGYEGIPPKDLNDAAGRMIHQDEKLRCFGCHATNAVQGKQLTFDKLAPGVQCAHCHQGIDAHLAAALAGNPQAAAPPDLHKLIGLSADQASNFCGQCHRTWAEIAAQPNPGIANIRFQPYRLTSSKCYDPDDARISCLACHNPHHDFSNPRAVNFDAKCLACHAGGKPVVGKVSVAKPGAKACPVAKENCISCHMPRIELPGAHYKFTDHRIRIVKPNEGYPG